MRPYRIFSFLLGLIFVFWLVSKAFSEVRSLSWASNETPSALKKNTTSSTTPPSWIKYWPTAKKPSGGHKAIVGLSGDIDQPFYDGCVRPDVKAARANATILVLARNSDLDGAVSSVRSMELHFNRWFNYPYTFLNNEPFSDEFKLAISAVASSHVEYGIIPKNEWEFPSDITEDLIEERLEYQADHAFPYGRKLSYHQMCRFFSGMFYRHKLLQKYDWYWRLEPDVEFYCDTPYDVFMEMEKHGKVYGYSVILGEFEATVSNLFRHTAAYKRKMGLPDTDVWAALTNCQNSTEEKHRIRNNKATRFMDGCEYNLCHFWDNFEIARFDLWRNPLYEGYFQTLEKSGGFWYERWGDAPVHTLGVALMLNASQIHYFRDIGYSHTKIGHCPANSMNQIADPESDPDVASEDFSGYEKIYDAPRYNGVGCRCRCGDGGPGSSGIAPRESENDQCFKRFAKLLGVTKGENEYVY